MMKKDIDIDSVSNIIYSICFRIVKSKTYSFTISDIRINHCKKLIRSFIGTKRNLR